MTIYEHRTSLPAASGTFTTSTLDVQGGLMRNLLVRANTSTTVFKCELIDSNGITRINYGFHEGEINDQDIAFPTVGTYDIKVTNASADDTFQVLFAIQER